MKNTAGIKRRLMSVYWLSACCWKWFCSLFPHPPRCLIIPGDIHGLIGSRGDQAMFTVIVSKIQNRHERAIIDVAVLNPEKIRPVLPVGVGAVSFNQLSTKGRSRTATLAGYDELLIQGADIMDGFYNECFALQLWEMACEAASKNANSVVLGISLNGHITERVQRVIRMAPAGLKVGVRDPISLERLHSVRPGFGRLVADVAFLLSPRPLSRCATSIQQSLAWCQERRKAGSVVVGVNIHSMLFLPDNGKKMDQLIKAFALVLKTLIAQQDMSFLLLPHDFRAGIADELVLEKLARLIQPHNPENIRLHSDASNADEIKTLTSGLDALVTGRMHLGIAALGQSVPIAALAYQGKFEGLFRLFGLPDELVLPPAVACCEEKLLRLFKTLLTERQSFSATISSSLPKILDLSEINFDL
jgi:polysaccharide pyruvyl transferase WcaK-like protein